LDVLEANLGFARG